MHTHICCSCAAVIRASVLSFSYPPPFFYTIDPVEDPFYKWSFVKKKRRALKGYLVYHSNTEQHGQKDQLRLDFTLHTSHYHNSATILGCKQNLNGSLKLIIIL